MYGDSDFKYVWHMCAVSVEARREHRIPQNWSYKGLWVTTGLGIEILSSRRAASILTCQASSPVQEGFQKCFLFHVMYAPKYMYVHHIQRSVESLGYPGAEVAGVCESPNVGAGNLAHIPYKGRNYSSWLNCLLNPKGGFESLNLAQFVWTTFKQKH